MPFVPCNQRGGTINNDAVVATVNRAIWSMHRGVQVSYVCQEPWKALPKKGWAACAVEIQHMRHAILKARRTC
ncbi:hypothetical protein WJX77_012551 [Trebouxia sp. C0004]